MGEPKVRDKAKILLVEDDLELCERLKDWFSLENHVVEDVTSGEDALQMLRNYHFDIIVLDLGLPGMPGVEVCKKYRSEGGRTPILFL
ncbi:MAG: response regulator transcription factor, partial [Terriglobales bacterium]